MAKGTKRNYTNWCITGAVLLLVISSLSFFVTNNIYDSQRFATKTTEAITSEPAREAIAEQITSEILKDQSQISQRLLTEPSEALISGLLKSDAFSNVFYDFSNSLNRFLTTKDIKPVTIDISSITSTVDTVVDTIEPNNNLDLSRFDDEEITLFEDTDLPPFKTIGQTLLIIGPISLLALLVLAVISFRKLDDKKELLKHSGLVLLISGILLLVLTYTSSGLLTVAIIDPERSTVMQAIYNSFVSNFRILQVIMIALGGALYGIYYYVKNDISLSVESKKN